MEKEIQDRNISQQSVIAKEVLRKIIILILFFIFGLLAILLLNYPVILKAFLIQACISLVGLLLLAGVAPRFVKRLSSVYFLFWVSGFIAIFLLVPVAIWVSLGNIVLISVGLISIGLGFYSFTITVRKKFKSALKINLDSGFLNLKNGTCDLHEPLRFAPPDVEKKEELRKERFMRMLYPFGPPLGYYLSRRFGGPQEGPVVALVIFLMAYFSFQLPAKDLAIALELLELEKEIGKKIVILSSNET